MKHDTIIFDLDDTLLNFRESEKICFLNTMQHFGIPENKIDVSLFAILSKRRWKLYTDGNCNFSDALHGRFIDYAKEKDIVLSAKDTDDYFENQLSFSAILLEAEIFRMPVTCFLPEFPVSSTESVLSSWRFCLG